MQENVLLQTIIGAMHHLSLQLITILMKRKTVEVTLRASCVASVFLVIRICTLLAMGASS